MLVWGQSGTLLKEQGSYELDISLKDIERPSKWPTFIGTERAQNHLLFYSILFYSFLREEDECCWRQGLGEGKVFGYKRQDVRPNRIK